MLLMEPDLRPLANKVAIEVRRIALFAFSLKVMQQFRDLENLKEEGAISPQVEKLRLASWGWLLGMSSDTDEITTIKPSLNLDFTFF